MNIGEINRYRANTTITMEKNKDGKGAGLLVLGRQD